MSVVIASFTTMSGGNFTQSDSKKVAQAFGVLSAAKLSQITLSLTKNTGVTGDVKVELFAGTGTYGTDMVPTGSALATSGTIDASTFTDSFDSLGVAETFSFTGSDRFVMETDTDYCLVLDASGASGQIGYNDNFSSTYLGNMALSTDSTSSWDAYSGQAMYFIVEGDLLPVASFSTSQTNVQPDETITFTDTSTNTPTSWSWDFGDSSTASTDQNPTHSYSAAGTYTVTLTATNAAGDDTATTDITVVVKPTLTGISTLTGVSSITFA